ncbi:TetR family transcriptional regulator [Rhizorhabdus wittichii]|uniref:TetR family transcriptional regulator n=1 Tax=Rhizorhabdus wittichii TaxID=160791 RepID=A0A975D2C0_9SPHN|nr:TetR family transcriptional regulator [Rhizorhabdus wittichii]
MLRTAGRVRSRHPPAGRDIRRDDPMGEQMANETGSGGEVDRRKNPKQQRAVTTVDAITQATQQIIIKEGFRNATTNRIAEVAGVSVGSLYQYFPNKQAIIKTLIEETVSKAAAKVRTGLRRLMEEPLEPALRQIMTLLLAMYKENDFILFRILDQVPELKEYTKNLSVEIYTYSTNLAFLEQHETEIVVADLPTALLIIERATIHNIECFLAQNPTGITEEQLIDELTRMALNYLTK